jgi:hypothetical protein
VDNVWADTGLQFPVFAMGTDKRFGITMPEDVPMTVQDRTYTSPI